MRVTVLTQYYPPEVGAPQRRLSQLVEGLVARGHQVTVLTAMPNYPTGKIFANYGGLVRTETIGGARVIRTFIYPTQSAGLRKRLTNYYSFAVSSLLVGLFQLPACDYLLTESPPLFLGITGFLLSHAKRAKWIFNVSDLWPESAVRVGVLNPGIGLRISTWLEKFCYQKAWLVSGQSHSILENIRARFPTISTYLFSNGVNPAQFSPMFRENKFRQYTDGTRPVALYAGLHGLAQGLEQILDAAQQAGDNLPIEIFLLGDGPSKRGLAAQAQQQHLCRVHFLDAVPANDMPAWIASADIALITLKEYIPGAVPSKLYEAMASGAAVLLVANGEPADIVKQHDAGRVVEPGDTQGLVNALQCLAGDPALRQRLAANARRAVEMYYDRRVIVERFIEYLEKNHSSQK